MTTQISIVRNNECALALVGAKHFFCSYILMRIGLRAEQTSTVTKLVTARMVDR